MTEPLQITHLDTFLWRFRAKERVMSLTPEDVAMLRQAAEQGDAYARYGLGRWLYYRNPDDNAMREAEQLFLDLQDEIPDALAAYAMMLRYGETKENRMDIGQSQQLLQRAIHRGSELADLQSARFSIFGLFCDAEPEGMATIIERRLNGCQHCDRLWFRQLAYAYEELGRTDDAIRCYEQAISLGEVSAYIPLAIIYNQREDIKRYNELMEEGLEKGCALCMIYQADMDYDEFDALNEDEKAKIHKTIEERLLRGLQLGEGVCAYYLWLHHYYGGLGFEEDEVKATAYLEEGVRLGDTACISRLATEAQEGHLPDGRQLSPNEIAELWLKAARYSPYDVDVLNELRHVDDPAFLLMHKEELERYWQPLIKEKLGDMEAPVDIEPLEDPKTPIDPTVIVIWPTGHLELMEADVYKMKTYREMGQELIGADNLDSMYHTPLLHLIGEAAELDLPLVMFCDREAYAKELPDNAIGTLFYGHDWEVRGPIIICQRDPVGDCHSFKTLEDLTKTYSEINKHCGGLLIVKDEEDGKFDAWA